MKFIKEIFTGTNGSASSKRVVGAICITYAMIMCAVAFFVSGGQDIPPNVQVVSLQFLITGASLIGLGVLEKTQNEKI
jgi:hypothetical protein